MAKVDHRTHKRMAIETIRLHPRLTGEYPDGRWVLNISGRKPQVFRLKWQAMEASKKIREFAQPDGWTDDGTGQLVAWWFVDGAPRYWTYILPKGERG